MLGAGPMQTVAGDGKESAPRYKLGLDIGGAELAAGVVDERGGVRGFVTEPTSALRGPQDGLARLFELGRRAAVSSGLEWEEIDGVGIGCGGPVDAEAGILIAPLHLHGWTDVP